jgi:uncharacterized protein YjiS (DUF1127 family)
MTNIFQMIRQWQRRLAAAQNLNPLNDRMLADIGIARGDIKAAQFDRQGRKIMRKSYDSDYASESVADAKEYRTGPISPAL